MEDKNYIIVSKIIKYVEKILSYIEGVDKSTFVEDSKLLEACIFNLLQIGEIANRLDEDFQSRYTEIPWSKIRGLRNRLVHDYEGVNFELLWQVVEGDLDVLHRQLLSIL